MKAVPACRAQLPRQLGAEQPETGPGLLGHGHDSRIHGGVLIGRLARKIASSGAHPQRPRFATRRSAQDRPGECPRRCSRPGNPHHWAGSETCERAVDDVCPLQRAPEVQGRRGAIDAQAGLIDVPPLV